MGANSSANRAASSSSRQHQQLQLQQLHHCIDRPSEAAIVLWAAVLPRSTVSNYQQMMAQQQPSSCACQ